MAEVRPSPHPQPAIVPAKIRPARERGLSRRRLEDMLSRGLWERRLTVIAAPAGSGKTTLLSQFATSVSVPAAWYRAESSDAAEDVILSYLYASLRTVLPSLPKPWNSVEDAARALEHCPQPRILLVLDDLHTIQGTPAESAFERLLAYSPPSLTVFAASRCSPSLTSIPGSGFPRSSSNWAPRIFASARGRSSGSSRSSTRTPSGRRRPASLPAGRRGGLQGSRCSISARRARARGSARR